MRLIDPEGSRGAETHAVLSAPSEPESEGGRETAPTGEHDFDCDGEFTGVCMDGCTADEDPREDKQ